MKRVYLVLVLIIYASFALSQQSSNVTLLSTLDPYPSLRYSDIWGYTDEQGREYALIGAELGISIIEISDPASPVERAFIPGPESRWRDIKTHDTYAYAVNEGTGAGEGLQIIDLSDLPDTAVLVNTISTWFATAHNLYIDSGYAYVVGSHDGGGMHILDISSPVNPDRISYYDGSGYIHDVYVWNDTAYASAGATYDLVDLSDKMNPQLVSSSAALAEIYAHSGWLTEDKRYFIACEEANVRDIIIWDLQDRSMWALAVPSFQTPGISPVHNVFVKGNYAHIAYYADGYVILDISDPLNPTIAGRYDTHPDTNAIFAGLWGVYPFFPSGVVVGSDISTGLYVFDFTGDGTTAVEDISSDIPSGYFLSHNYPNPFNPSTAISYSIPYSGYVTLKIYDVLGREAAVLVNQYMEAGKYNFNFDASGLNSGTYFYRLTSGTYTETKKMILLK